MSNSEPSAIVLQGIPCIGGLYISLDSNEENGLLKVRRDSPDKPSHVFLKNRVGSSVLSSSRFAVFRTGAVSQMHCSTRREWPEVNLKLTDSLRNSTSCAA